MKLIIADSGTTRHAVNSKIGMTNYRLLSDYTLSTASGEPLEVEGMSDLYVGFRSDSEQKPGTMMNHIIQLKRCDSCSWAHKSSAVFASHGGRWI